MKIQTWIVLAIAYILLICIAVRASHFYDHILPVSPLISSISIGIAIGAVTLGIAIAIIMFYTERKK